MYIHFPKRIWIISLALLITTGAGAQVKRLTISEAIDLGMNYSKQLKISTTKVDVNSAKYKQEIALLAPAVSINSSITHNSTNLPFLALPFGPNGQLEYADATNYNYYLNRLNVSQVIFAGVRGWNTLATIKGQSRAAQYDLEADKLTTKNNIIVTYYNHYKLLESKKVVEENIKVLEQRLKDAQNLQTVGMGLKNDVLQVQMSISSLQQNAAEVQSAIDVNNYNMDVMFGLPETTKIEIVEEGLLNGKMNFDLNNGLQNALRKRPEVLASDIRLDISNKMLKIAKGMYSPVISGTFNAYYDKPNQREFFEPEVLFHNSWDIGIKLNWNITGLFTNQFQTKEAKINIAQAQAQHEQLNDNIKMEVNADYADYRLALDKIALNQQSIEQAQENQRMTKDQYTNGVKNITDMLNADNLVVVSQINMLNAKIDAEIAYAKLMKATAN